MRYPKFNGKPLPKILRGEFDEIYNSLKDNMLQESHILNYNIDKQLDTIAYNITTKAILRLYKGLIGLKKVL